MTSNNCPFYIYNIKEIFPIHLGYLIHVLTDFCSKNRRLIAGGITITSPYSKEEIEQQIEPVGIMTADFFSLNNKDLIFLIKYCVPQEVLKEITLSKKDFFLKYHDTLYNKTTTNFN